MGPVPLGVAQAVLRELLLEAQRNFPAESCGLVLGSRGSGGLAPRAESVLCLANQLQVPAALGGFRLDPVDLLRAERGARASQLEVLGPWHSHPAGAAQLSRRDRDGATGYPFQFLLPAPSVGPPRLAIWRREGQAWREQEWCLQENSAPSRLSE